LGLFLYRGSCTAGRIKRGTQIRVTNKTKIIFGEPSFLPFSFLQASSSSTLRFYATNRYLLRLRIQILDLPFAYEKFGVLFKTTSLPSSDGDRSAGDGLACFTSAIGIRKAGRTLPCTFLDPRARGGEVSGVFLWEGCCEDCVCHAHDT